MRCRSTSRRRSTELCTLQFCGRSAQCIAVLVALLQEGVARIKLGPVVTEAIPMAGCVPEGAPESPMLFILVVEMILRELQAVWHARGSGWIC